MLKGFFIGASDTDAGKTYIASQLVRALNKAGFTPAPRKPLATGCQKITSKMCHKKPGLVSGDLFCRDTYELYQANQERTPLTTITPFAFEPASSPHQAMTHNPVHFEAIVQSCQAEPHETLVVEGVGGYFSPLNTTHLNIHLAQTLNLTNLLVIPNHLGALNQTLAQIYALKAHNIPVHGLILNQTSPNPPYIQAQDLKNFISPLPPLMQIDYNATIDLDQLLNTLTP